MKYLYKVFTTILLAVVLTACAFNSTPQVPEVPKITLSEEVYYECPELVPLDVNTSQDVNVVLSLVLHNLAQNTTVYSTCKNMQKYSVKVIKRLVNKDTP